MQVVWASPGIMTHAMCADARRSSWIGAQESGLSHGMSGTDRPVVLTQPDVGNQRVSRLPALPFRRDRATSSASRGAPQKALLALRFSDDEASDGEIARVDTS